MNFTSSDFEYGSIIVTKGPHKGRIGALDDTTTQGKRTYGYVYFAGFGIASTYALVPISYLRRPNTRDFLDRRETLWRAITPYLENALEGDERIDALQELAYVDGLLNDRMFEAQFMSKNDGVTIFLSHSSIDKSFVRALAVDLASMGHKPWLDEWEILGGESIPTRIAEGLENCEFIVLVLSSSSVNSSWVENEWQAKHWEEVSSRKVSVIPILLNDCKIPSLLKMKRYIDFRYDYTDALQDLSRSLKGHISNRVARASNHPFQRTTDGAT